MGQKKIFFFFNSNHIEMIESRYSINRHIASIISYEWCKLKIFLLIPQENDLNAKTKQCTNQNEIKRFYRHRD